jgi:hypothetical protein
MISQAILSFQTLLSGSNSSKNHKLPAQIEHKEGGESIANPGIVLQGLERAQNARKIILNDQKV